MTVYICCCTCGLCTASNWSILPCLQKHPVKHDKSEGKQGAFDYNFTFETSCTIQFRCCIFIFLCKQTSPGSRGMVMLVLKFFYNQSCKPITINSSASQWTSLTCFFWDHSKLIPMDPSTSWEDTLAPKLYPKCIQSSTALCKTLSLRYGRSISLAHNFFRCHGRYQGRRGAGVAGCYM